MSVVVRRARPEDLPARADLVRRALCGYQRDAFFLFFFQELTLQLGVLGGAVLFIFCGLGAARLLLLAPAAAALLAAAVALAHHSLADTHAQRVGREALGAVAEYRGPLRAGAPPALALPPARMLHYTPPEQYAVVVGTASVSRVRGARGPDGWLHALAVHPEWRRRGIGGALLEAISSEWESGPEGGGEGGRLHCVISELQEPLRTLLHKHGWGVRGWYHRRLCGAALTLALAHLAR